MWTDLRNNAGVVEMPLRGPAGAAGANGLWSNTALAKTALYTVGNADKGKTIGASGGPYTITINAATTYDADFGIVIVNTDPLTKTGQILDGRGVLIAASGHDSFWLYPGQTATLRRSGSAWRIEREKRWQAPKSTNNIYCNNGTANGDTNNDGLRAASAFQTLQHALGWILDNVDPYGGAVNTTQWEIHMAAGVVSDPGAHFSPHAFPGAQGGAYVRIVGGAGAGITAVGRSCFELYYGCVLQIQGLILTSDTAAGINCLWGAKAYISDITFGDCASAHIQVADPGTKVELYGDITIIGDAAFHVVASGGAQYKALGHDTLVDEDITVTDFVMAVSCGVIDYSGGSTITLGAGDTVTGRRGSGSLNGVIISDTAAPNTFFPGTSNTVAITGAQIV